MSFCIVEDEGELHKIIGVDTASVPGNKESEQKSPELPSEQIQEQKQEPESGAADAIMDDVVKNL